MQGNEAARPIFEAWLKPFAYLGATTLTTLNTGGTDHMVFNAAGLPGFQFLQDPLDYETRAHHSSQDVYEEAVPDEMPGNAADQRALAAAFRMRDSVHSRENDLLVKIVIHEGPCLAVTLNDRLDYFGQTVNIAARVQNLAQRARRALDFRGFFWLQFVQILFERLTRIDLILDSVRGRHEQSGKAQVWVRGWIRIAERRFCLGSRSYMSKEGYLHVGSRMGRIGVR